MAAETSTEITKKYEELRNIGSELAALTGRDPKLEFYMGSCNKRSVLGSARERCGGNRRMKRQRTLGTRNSI